MKNMKNKFLIYAIGASTVIIPHVGKFPGGEVMVNISSYPKNTTEARIEAYLFSSDDVMTLVMLVDALREIGVEKIRLTMPYIPYARQDRVCNPGEAHSIRAFARIINALQFSSVVVYDPHSPVSTALIERCIVESQTELMHDCVSMKAQIWCDKTQPWYLVSPDAGSVKKISEVFNEFPNEFKGIIYAEKVRDLATGRIIKTVVKDLPSDIASAKLLVVDDICDGGRTFIELAKVLRGCCKGMSLYVTHGIFSQGMEVFEPFYDNVWCTVNFKDYK